MMNALINKVEIIFWDRITPAISDSRIIQSLIKNGYNILHDQEMEKTLLWGISAGVFGILTGLALSIISGLN